MSYGICSCTMGPPPWPQRCGACGASNNPPYFYEPMPPVYTPMPVTEERMREIIREEIRAALRDDKQ